MFQTWDGAYRGVVVYRFSLMLSVAASSLMFLGLGAGDDVIALGGVVLVGAGLLALVSVALFSVGVPMWAQAARTQSGFAAISLVVGSVTGLWARFTYVGFSIHAYDRVSLLQQISAIAGGAGMVLFMWSWRSSAEAVNHSVGARACEQALIAACVSGVLSFGVTLESTERATWLPFLALAAKVALLVTAWRAAKALEVALFPE